MFSAKNIVLLTEINGFFDASLLHNYMDVINETQLWFKFDPSNRFIKDFYKVWNSEVFFLAIEDSLLINLYYSNKNYFKIDIVTDVPDARSDHRRYDYIKYTFVDPERYKD